MFVSSYSTYINTNATDRIQKEKHADSYAQKQFRFAPQQTDKNSLDHGLQLSKTELPLNYVSNYKVLSNQQKLQQNLQQKTEENQKEKNRGFKTQILQKAQSAYEENSTLFASLRKPKLTLAQTPSPSIEQNSLRAKMVNTYISNDNYYKKSA